MRALRLRLLLLLLLLVCSATQAASVHRRSARQQHQPSSPNIATAQYLTDYPMAKSLDGTPAYYYIRRAAPGSVNASKFVIHIQGGGWCGSLENCAQRAQTNLGSSDHEKTKEQDTQDLNLVHGCQNNRWCGALMVNDAATNPLAHDWNAVLLRYTDGASWIGDLESPVTVNGQRIYFRGRFNLEAVLADLIGKHGLSMSTDVLIGGDSAGGLATFLHVDKMRDAIHQANLAAGVAPARVLGMPDSGFWPDDTAQEFSSTFRAMFKMQTNHTAAVAGLPKNCKHKSSNVTRCLFPQYFADEIETRLWPLQSLFDPLQKGKHPQAHGFWLLDQINETILLKPREAGDENGAWLHSCERHCGAELLTIDGVQVPEALACFLSRDPGATPRSVWLQKHNYPCEACCNDQ
eukprot:SAG31_NODE_470_length_15239_cov_19.376288_10_plen_406_part_00